MADFFQNGPIATLHRLSDRPTAELEADLAEWSVSTPLALVIPSLYRELERPAMNTIVNELTRVPYLDEVIVGIDRADAVQFADAKRFFTRLPQDHRLLWNDGPLLRELDQELQKEGIAPRHEGKGRNVWYCLGYFLARGRGSVVATHDADIVGYSRDMLARLLYPVAHPSFGYAFGKGYYYRSDGAQLNGRVSRLLVSPLIRALRDTLGANDYLEYLDAFRYPLAGEFAMRSDVVHNLRIPSDWGLEIGLLSEVYRRYTPRRICQIDIADAYDHKHRELSAHDPDSGLHKMAIDITKALFRKLAVDGEVFTTATFRTLKASYYRGALDLVDQYHNDAVLNGLGFDRHREEEAVELFARAVMEAGSAFLENPMETPFIASWSRVTSAIPDVFERLIEAVEADAD
ncbi:MAG: glycosyl transferase [Actinomycetia bacterium]|nr:glycosyl transferase [Actinomycetes bacterium]